MMDDFWRQHQIMTELMRLDWKEYEENDRITRERMIKFMRELTPKEKQDDRAS